MIITGQLLFSRTIYFLIEENPEFRTFVFSSFKRHSEGDWGECNPNDKKLNDEALESKGRLFSSYSIPNDCNLDEKKVWIITEWDRTITTILFPQEY